ncbi:hypothetical protein AB0L56_05465 [Streptomyces sp. NPDC052079]|uniref:hypothetical protein n=1 Tax=Streptomyces sp. NPDC052079 TaxID=3155526 RepID=UPI00341BDF43
MSGDAPHEATEAVRAEALDLYARALDEGHLPAATDAQAPLLLPLGLLPRGSTSPSSPRCWQLGYLIRRSGILDQGE